MLVAQCFRRGNSLRRGRTGRAFMTLRVLILVCAVVFNSLMMSGRAAASFDVVLEWNDIAVATMLTPPAATPFGQARYATIVQLAVFEAVNAITGDYEPYLGTVTGQRTASAEAAAVAAAHMVLSAYFPGSASSLDARRTASLAAIADGQPKIDGIRIGEDAASKMIDRRAHDGSFPLTTHAAATAGPGVWQTTLSCAATANEGAFFNWQNVTTFGIPSASAFVLDAPPALTSDRYAIDYNEVMTVGRAGTNAARPQDRSDVARIYRDTSPTNLLNSAARQVASQQGRSLSENARALALLNMATNDSLVASFATKYTYGFWRPETAIRGGAIDGNPNTTADAFVP